MDLGDLRRAWHATGKDRPAWVREHADDLRSHLTIDEDIPDEGSMYRLRDWLERYRGTVTRQLDDAIDGADPHNDHADGETPTTDADETEDE